MPFNLRLYHGSLQVFGSLPFPYKVLPSFDSTQQGVYTARYRQRLWVRFDTPNSPYLCCTFT